MQQFSIISSVLYFNINLGTFQHQTGPSLFLTGKYSSLIVLVVVKRIYQQFSFMFEGILREF